MTAQLRRHPLSAALLAVTLAAMGGCATRSAPDPSAGEVEGMPPPASDKPAVMAPDEGQPARPLILTVLDAGAEPRIPLRYDLALGHTERLRITMAMAMQTSLPGMDSQTIQVPAYDTFITMTVGEITPEGNYRVDYRVDDVVMEVDPTADFPQQEIMVAELEKLEGTAGWNLMSPRGQTLRVEVTSTGGAGDQVRSTMGNLEQTLDQAAVPFPEEAVGAGARWQAESTVAANEIMLSQVSTYHLTEVRDGGGTIEVSLVQTAEPQLLPAPEELPDAEIELTAMRSDSSGTVVFDLSRISPLLAMVLDMGLSTTTRAMGMSLDTQVQTHMDIQMEPAD